MTYFFILGNNSALSVAEILNKFQPKKYSLINKEVLKVEFSEALDEQKVIKKIGGTIKIVELAEEISSGSSTSGELLGVVKKYLPEEFIGKFKFGFSFYGGRELDLKKTAMDVKRELKAREISCRWIVSKGDNLSSVVVAKNKLTDAGKEFVIVFNDGKKYLGITKAVQDFEGLSFRDYNRPARDSHSGMIPPKLAQIMLNIGLQGKTNQILLDPFCGSGTILMEAMLLGVKKIIGSDISEKAVKNSQKNLEWVQEKFHLSKKNDFELKKGSATELLDVIKSGGINRLRKVRGKTEQRTKFTESVNRVSGGGFDEEIFQTGNSFNSIDVVVTEPYLGPQEKVQDIEKVKKDLEILYTKVIEEFRKILKDDGRVVMIWPFFKGIKEGAINPEIKGFKIVNQIPVGMEVKRTNRKTIIYGRKGQRVWREVVALEKAN